MQEQQCSRNGFSLTFLLSIHNTANLLMPYYNGGEGMRGGWNYSTIGCKRTENCLLSSKRFGRITMVRQVVLNYVN